MVDTYHLCNLATAQLHCEGIEYHPVCISSIDGKIYRVYKTRWLLEDDKSNKLVLLKNIDNETIVVLTLCNELFMQVEEDMLVISLRHDIAWDRF